METVSLEAGTFKNCLRVSTVSNEQQSHDWTVEWHDISWYAHNVGLIKHELIETFRHPVEEDYDRNNIYEFIRTTVDGVDYP